MKYVLLAVVIATAIGAIIIPSTIKSRPAIAPQRNGDIKIPVAQSFGGSVEGLVSPDGWRLPDEIDFGTLPSGSIAKRQIEVSNTGRAPVRLSLIGTDCGCTSGTKTLLLEPGESSFLESTLDTKGRELGELTRKMIYRIGPNADDIHVIHAKAKIVEPLVSPLYFSLGAAQPAESIRFLAQIDGDSGWVLQDVQFHNPDGATTAAIDWEPVSEGVSLLLTPPEIVGRFQQPLIFNFQDSKNNTVIVRAIAEVLVTNPLIEQPEAYLGIVSRTKKTYIEAEFNLLLSDLRLTDFSKPDEIHLALKAVSVDDQEQGHVIPVLLIRHEINESTPLGLNEKVLEYDDGEWSCTLPVRFLVLR